MDVIKHSHRGRSQNLFSCDQDWERGFFPLFFDEAIHVHFGFFFSFFIFILG